MKINQMRRRKGYLLRAYCSKGVSHYHLYLATTQRKAEESFMVVKKEGFNQNGGVR